MFENDAFIVMDKPAGWLSVAGRGAKPTDCLLHHMTQARGTQFWPVHRLDQPVSGLILYAKNAAAHRLGNSWFEGRHVGKTYEAWSEGVEFPKTGATFTWSHKILRGKKRAYEHAIGKVAITHAQFLGETNGVGRWELKPETGRSHQLRFQLSKAGFPICGDALYGAKTPQPEGTIQLRACRLDFSKVEGDRAGLPTALEVTGIAEQSAG